MENAVIRGTRRHPVAIGDHVLIGPQAMFSAAGSARAPSSPPAAPSSTGQKSARGPRCEFAAPCIFRLGRRPGADRLGGRRRSGRNPAAGAP
jgi:hypothetical protein